jgi:hypothetical protein
MATPKKISAAQIVVAKNRVLIASKIIFFIV